MSSDIWDLGTRFVEFFFKIFFFWYSLRFFNCFSRRNFLSILLKIFPVFMRGIYFLFFWFLNGSLDVGCYKGVACIIMVFIGFACVRCL